MKYNNLNINTLVIILLLIGHFQSDLNASLNPLQWFTSNYSSDKINLLEENTNNISPVLLDKLTKFKDNKNVKGQQKIYKKILLKYPIADAAKEAAFNRGLFLFKRGKWEEAFMAFAIIKEYHPDYIQLNAAIEYQFKCAINLMHQRKKEFWIFHDNSLYNPKSIPLFLYYAELYPYDLNTPLALLNAAKGAQSNNDFDSAIISLKKLINFYPESQFTPEAYFLSAHIYAEYIKGPEYDLETTREAIRYCEDFIALYPKHEDIHTVEVLYDRLINTLATNRVLLADYYYFNKRNNIAAIIFYNEAITIAPNSQAALEAQNRLDAIEMGVRPTTGQNFIKRLFLIR